jgi:AraC-like DNA-binding protein
MNYKVYTPSPELQSFVKCFWTLEEERQEQPVKQRIVPDGCMEMIFHYGDPYKQYFEDGSSIIQPGSFVFGQITKFIEIAPTGVSGIVSARFLPEGLMPFLPIPVVSLENRAVSIVDLFGEKGKTLEDEVTEARDNGHRIKLIEAFLLSLPVNPQIVDEIARSCVEEIFESGGQLGVIALADKTHISRRNIERRFTQAIGMSPKQLSRIVRLQATLKMLQQKQFTTLTSLAYENGYYDQAHFIKDFKEFTGISPKLFFAGNMELAGLFAVTE